MVGLTNGDVFYGGPLGYITQITQAGAFVQNIPAMDDEGNVTQVNGLSVARDGELYAAHGAVGGGVDWDPHDVVALPDNSGYLGVLARTNNTLILRQYDRDGVQVGSDWSLPVDATWTPARMARIDIACDGETLFYTTMGKRVQKYNLATSSALSDHAVRTDEYIYAAFKLWHERIGGIVVNETASGHGPLYAIAISADGKVWMDEVNVPDASYEIFKREPISFADILEHTARFGPSNTNAQVFSIATFYSKCSAGRALTYGLTVG